MAVQTANLQQLCDAVMSVWTTISQECLQHLVDVVLKVKESKIGKVYLIKWSVSVFCCISVESVAIFKPISSLFSV